MPRPEERLAHARFSPKNSSPNRRPIDRPASCWQLHCFRRRHEPNPPPPPPPCRRRPVTGSGANPHLTRRFAPLRRRVTAGRRAPRARLAHVYKSPSLSRRRAGPPRPGPATSAERARDRVTRQPGGPAHPIAPGSRAHPSPNPEPPIYSPPRTPRRDIATERADSKQLSSAALCFPSRRKLRALLERVCLPTSPARAP